MDKRDPADIRKGTYTARNNDLGTERDGLKFISGQRENVSLSVNAVVPIYDFGKTMYALEVANGRADLAELSARRQYQEVEFGVALGYFRLLEAQKILQVVEESIEVVQRQLQIAQEFLEQGLVANNDVLVVEVQLAQRQQEQLRAHNNVEVAKATLNRLMEWTSTAS
ncbi:MAG: TolC family protein [Planctomycetota bacterium]